MTFRSKALKNWTRKERGWLAEKIRDIYFDIKYAICKPFVHAKKVWEWYWNILRKDFDWDSGYVYHMLEYKLKRMEKSLLNGHAEQDPRDMKALRLAIKLLNRLGADSIYFERAHRDHNLKWGELITWTTPNYNADGEVITHTWHSRRPNANTPEEIEQERQEYRKTWELEDWLTKRDQRWLYDILNKYLRNWWD